MAGAVTSRALPSAAGAGPSERRPPPRRPPLTLEGLWHSTGFRSLLYQVLVVVAVLGTAAYMIGNAQEAMDRRGIATGFGFLFEEAGFGIGESVIAYEAADTYLHAFGVAILNTLKVSLLSVVLATLLGTLLGIARLSSNWLLARLASVYVEVFRNTPQLVQIIFWYTLVTRMPHPRQAWSLFDWAYLSNRGMVVAWPAADPVYGWMVAALVGAGAAAWGIARRADRHRRRTGHRVRVFWWNAALVIGLPLLVWVAGGMPMAMDVPELGGFNFVGGAALSAEFLALLLGLSLYIAAFIAEIVRSGIQSVGRGQIEAARSVGLQGVDLYRKVILPQALRVIVPPLGAQYISLFKNSSLGVAIGYPELFNITNTITTLSGHTIECIGIMMVVYLCIAATISALMNLYNRAVQIRER